MQTEWLNRKVWIQRKPGERGEGEEQSEEIERDETVLVAFSLSTLHSPTAIAPPV